MVRPFDENSKTIIRVVHESRAGEGFLIPADRADGRVYVRVPEIQSPTPSRFRVTMLQIVSLDRANEIGLPVKDR